MPLPLQVNSTTLLEFLIADVDTAWEPKTIFTHDPEDAAGETSSALREAYISLGGGSWDGEWASVNTDHAVMRWRITGRFLKPAGERLHSEKQARVNELLALLTAQTDYHGALWLPQNVGFDFGDNRGEGGQSYYEVTVTFQVEY